VGVGGAGSTWLMTERERFGGRYAVPPADPPPFEPPPDYADELPGRVTPDAIVRGFAGGDFSHRRELFGHFLDETEITDRQIAVTMAERARRIDELRRASVAIAAHENAEDLAKPPALRSNRHPESGWSIDNRAKTELATEIAMAFTLSKSAARNLVAESETLVTDLPLTLSAMDEGRIRYEHARVIATTAWSIPVESRAALEAELVPLAATLVLSAFRARAVAARERLHIESMAERHERAAAFRNVSVDLGEDGMGYLTLHDSNEVIAAIYNRVTDLAMPKAKDDPRTLAQRRADVTTEILVKGDLCASDGVSAESGSARFGFGHGIAAQVHVEVPVLTLLGVETTPATLEGTTPIDPVTARKLVAEATGFFRVLTDPITGSVVAFDDRFRFLPASLRRAVRLIDGTCTAPWCNASARESQGHHPDEWQHSHDTSLENSALLCGPDHALVHNTRWTMRKLPSGDKEWVSPCGKTRRVAPMRRLSPAFVAALKPDRPPTHRDLPTRAAPADDPWFATPAREGGEMPF
jgi:hypothetical protein